MPHEGDVPPDDLPLSVRELAELIGLDQAVHLCRSLPQCGSRPWRVAIYVPKNPPLDHKLVKILGYRDAMIVAHHFGGEVLQPSNGRFMERRRFRQHVWSLDADGLTPQQIAERTDRPIKIVKKTIEAKPPKEGEDDDR